MISRYKSSFEKDLLKVNNPEVFQKIKAVIEAIDQATSLQDIRNIKKIKGNKFAYGIKIGDYRAGFYFIDNVVEFRRFLHRKDTYKYFP